MYCFPCLWVYLQDKFLEVEFLSQRIVLTPITKLSSKEAVSIYTLSTIQECLFPHPFTKIVDYFKVFIFAVDSKSDFDLLMSIWSFILTSKSDIKNK